MRLSVNAWEKKTMLYRTELKDGRGILSREKEKKEGKQITKRKGKESFKTKWRETFPKKIISLDIFFLTH